MRPAWDGRIYDICNSNKGKAPSTRRYFSKPDQILDRGSLCRTGKGKSNVDVPWRRLSAQCCVCGALFNGSTASLAADHRTQHADITCSQLTETDSEATLTQSGSEDRLADEYLKQRAEITSAFAGGRTSPRTIRRLKQELLELLKKLDRCLGKDGDMTISVHESEIISMEGSDTPEALDEVQTPPQPTDCKGKGKAPPPPPPGGGGKGKGKGNSSASKLPPFGRRLDWHAVAKDKIKGTVFSELGSGESFNLSCLQTLFGQQQRRQKAQCTKTPHQKAVRLLDNRRMQSILIVLRKFELSDEAFAALEALNLDNEALSDEQCEAILSGALPTADEAETLLSYRGRSEDLAEGEQKLLALAQLQRPSAGCRLRVVLFRRSMCERAASIHKRLEAIGDAVKSVRSSSALRRILGVILRIGNALNCGAVQPEDCVVGGFRPDVLAKLALCKSTHEVHLSLLHFIAAWACAVDQHMPSMLSTELGVVRVAASFSLRELACEVATFDQEAIDASSCVSEMWWNDSPRPTKPTEAVTDLCKTGLGRTASTDIGCVDEEAAVHDSVDIAQGAGECLPGKTSTVASNASAEALSEFTVKASAKAASLKEHLHIVSTEAAEILDFLAEPSDLGQKEVDIKTQELFMMLSEFLDGFQHCVKQLSESPDLAAVCSSSGCDLPEPKQ